jgi:S-DNA-T family DNA segregation ATPase FtsK/SpoIIIE
VDGDRPALLLANTDDDQGASLQDVTLIGAKQLTEEPRLWVQAASAGLGLPDAQVTIWAGGAVSAYRCGTSPRRR